MSQLDTVIERDAAPSAGTVDMKLEVVVIPVADVDRAKRFYGGLGWRLDADFAASDEFRVVQFTPQARLLDPLRHRDHVGGAGLGTGTLSRRLRHQGRARRAHRRGAEVSEVFHRAGPGKPPLSGPDPERRSYSSYATFNDPDGNEWLLQEVTTRLPGRIDSKRRASPPHRIWRARCGARRPPTVSTRRARAASEMRTGRTGMRRTWWRSRPARSCRHEQRLRVIASGRCRAGTAPARSHRAWLRVPFDHSTSRWALNPAAALWPERVVAKHGNIDRNPEGIHR